MITKNNISAVLLSPPFCFFAKHGVFTKHYGSADEGFDLEYNVELGDFIYLMGWRLIEIQQRMNTRMRALWCFCV